MSSDKVANYPWTHGLVYVVAILLLAETIFRIMHHWHVLKESFFARVLLIICATFGLALLGWYSLAERARIITESPLIDATGYYQNRLFFAALLLAWVTFIVIEATVTVKSKKSEQKVDAVGSD